MPRLHCGSYKIGKNGINESNKQEFRNYYHNFDRTLAGAVFRVDPGFQRHRASVIF